MPYYHIILSTNVQFQPQYQILIMIQRIFGNHLKRGPSPLLLRYNYVSQKQIDRYLQEKNADQSTPFKKVQYFFYYVRYIMLEGFKEAKDDLLWIKGKSSSESLQSIQEVERYYRIKSNFGKLAVPFILNLLPLGNLLIIGMLQYSPETLPSWIQIEEREMERRIAYEDTKKFINKKFNVSEIDFKTADVEDLKILSLALTGRIVDGTIIINRIFGKQYNFESGPLSYVSAWLLRNHIKKYLKYQAKLHELPSASVQQKIRIMIGRK